MTARLRVAIDARRLQDNPLYGVGRGIANTIPYLTDDVAPTLLIDDRRPAPSIPGCDIVPLAGLGPLPETAWRQVSVARWLRRSNMQAFHGPYNAIPYFSPIPSVVTLHDLAWEHHTEDYSSRARHLTIAVQARFAVNRAKVVITVSQFIRASIAETYSVEPERILVAPNSVDPVFRPSQAGRTCTLLEPVGVAGAYVVALGGAKRRALPVAVEAWKRATKRGTRLPLVVVGSEPPPALDGVVYMGRLNDEDWAAILAGAVVLCYPTRYEGFGMPALEAAACGTPVVCARVGPLPEILGEAAEWCKAPTADEIAKGLERVINDPIRRATLSEAGRKAAASAPTWADSARVLIEAYRRAVL